MKPPSEEEFVLSEMLPASPQHGYRGERPPSGSAGGVPAAVTVAISREAGARGSTIGHRAAQKLGWQIYNQELLEYIAQEGAFRQNFVDNLSPEAAQWAEQRLQNLLREQSLSQHPSIMDLARIILALGAQGEVVIVGRGAGCILPPLTTLNVRIVAPLSDRCELPGALAISLMAGRFASDCSLRPPQPPRNPRLDPTWLRHWVFVASPSTPHTSRTRR